MVSFPAEVVKLSFRSRAGAPRSVLSELELLQGRPRKNSCPEGILLGAQIPEIFALPMLAACPCISSLSFNPGGRKPLNQYPPSNCDGGRSKPPYDTFEFRPPEWLRPKRQMAVSLQGSSYFWPGWRHTPRMATAQAPNGSISAGV